ncbi:MAG: hypothetical protein AAGF12_25295 [Myxococcota bacterium]
MKRFVPFFAGLLLFAGFPLATASAQVSADVTQPLSAEAARVLAAVPHEGTEAPNEHYYRSNEWRQDLLIPHLDGLGGALVGVGSDQNYTMAAMAQSSLLFMVDYDPRIPWVHEVYSVLVQASETPEALLARFSAAEERRSLALLREGLSDHPERQQILNHWESRRGAWHSYLRRVARLERNGQPFSWLASSEMYNYTRNLFRNGRVIARNGDVTSPTTMRPVAQAAEELGVPIRLVYFSNAEQFFPYTDAFKENMRQLGTDEESIVVRTIRHRSIEIARDGRWHYMIHDFADFQSRLDTGAYDRSFAFTADLLSAGPPFLGRNGISTMTRETPRTVFERAQRRQARRRP